MARTMTNDDHFTKEVLFATMEPDGLEAEKYFNTFSTDNVTDFVGGDSNSASSEIRPQERNESLSHINDQTTLPSSVVSSELGQSLEYLVCMFIICEKKNTFLFDRSPTSLFQRITIMKKIVLFLSQMSLW